MAIALTTSYNRAPAAVASDRPTTTPAVITTGSSGRRISRAPRPPRVVRAQVGDHGRSPDVDMLVSGQRE